MLLEYISTNFMTLMILFALTAIMIANRHTAIPATGLLYTAVFLMLILTAADYLDNRIDSIYPSLSPEEKPVYLRIGLIACTVRYIVEPVIILLELLLLIPNMIHPGILALPAVVNTVIYGSSLFTPKYGFGLDSDYKFHRGIFGLSIYYVLVCYVLLLVVLSITRFKRINLRRGIIVVVIVAMSIITSVFEYTNTITGYSTQITALCVLIYYSYLSSVYQKEMQIEIAEKELQIAKDNIVILRNQIHPHFIFNSLSIIRSLTKRDKDKAIIAIDSFSDYLKAHVGAMQSDENITLERELENVKAYLTLVQSDYTRQVEVVYDIQDTDVWLPALTIEPLVENAVKYGIGKDGGTITISSFVRDGDHIIRVSDSGYSKNELTDKEIARLGVGVDNTRKRLAMQCGGKLVVNIAETGSTAEIIIPISEV